MELGIFSSFWDGQPNHLPLLDLQEMEDEPTDLNLKTSLSKLQAILESSCDDLIQKGIKLLLEDEDWRPHLVACVSFLIIKSSRRDSLVALFWDRLLRGSWVSPQILVTLSMTDKEFKAKGEKILAEGFKISYSKLSAIDHHLSRGGSPTSVSEQKILAAVNYLLNDVVNETNDNDQGGDITKHWRENLMKLIEQGKLNFEPL